VDFTIFPVFPVNFRPAFPFVPFTQNGDRSPRRFADLKIVEVNKRKWASKGRVYGKIVVQTDKFETNARFLIFSHSQFYAISILGE
jgi:hypothetical protein